MIWPAPLWIRSILQAAAAGQVRRAPKIRTPIRNEFFRAFGYKQVFNLHEDKPDGKIDKDFYVVMPQMAAAMEGETFKAYLVPCVNKHQIPFIWPVRILEADDKASSWVDTRHLAVEMAEGKWVKIRANQKQGAGYYDIFQAKGELGEPEFPAKDATSYLQVLDEAIPKERKIATPDHPIFFKKIEGRL
jgi:hypothetical protein